MLKERSVGKEWRNRSDRSSIPSSRKTLRPRGLSNEIFDFIMISVPVVRVIINDDLESHALNINGNALHHTRKPLLRTRAQDPRIISLITITLPIIPDLSSRLGIVIQYKTTFSIEAQLAVSPVDAWHCGEYDIALGWVRAYDERAWAFGW